MFTSLTTADPVTKTWLRQNLEPIFGFPSVIRFSWKTTDNLLKGAVRVEWLTEQQQQAQLAAEGGGDGSDEDAPPLKRARKKPALARAPFFSSRGIEVCEGFDS